MFFESIIFKTTKFLTESIILNCINMKSLTEISWKYLLNRQVILYLIFGILTTLVNILTYILFVYLIGINYLFGNILAWFVSVVFAYITNRIWVFESKNGQIISEFTFFVGGRLFSGFLDTLLLYMFIDLLSLDDLFSKIVIGIIVVIVNYILSKYIVFKSLGYS